MGLFPSFKTKLPGKYEPVSTGDDASDSSPTRTMHWSRRTSNVSVPSVLIAIAGAIFFSFFGALIGRQYPSTATCVTKLTIYSPLNEAVEYEDFNFDNKFAHKTEFRGPPTEELEETWTEMWQMGEIRIDEDKIEQLNAGREPKEFKKFPEEEGGGYAAGIMMFHQLHCLNYLRQYTWGDYYETHNMTPPLHSSALGQRMHVDHCIEELRKTIMCYGDTTPMLVEILPDAPIGMKSDFDARHRCRKFDKLHKWVEDHVVKKW